VNAITARWEPEQLRLWASSALGAVLVHLIPAALLILVVHWSAQPKALPGSPAALDVELASMPAAGSPAASSSSHGPSHSPPATHPRLAAVNALRPLGQMHSAARTDTSPSDSAAVPRAGTISAPEGSSDLGTPGAPNPDVQLWEDEIVARLASYKEYPDSALHQQQQDTVTLQFSIDHAGKVTYSRVDSAHHYPALEQEVQQMLRLAGRLPAPPPQLSSNAVVTVPVQFELDFTPDILCGELECPHTHGAPSKPKAVAPPPPTLASCTAPASPGPVPAGATATLAQMRAYREHLNQYLAAAGSQLACLSQVRETNTLALRNTLTRQLHSMVDDFNAQAYSFQTQAQARALQARQARQRQTQALAAQVYAACTPPSAAPVPGTLTAARAPRFRRQLLAYQSAVRSYVACLRRAERAATAPDHGLADDQRAQLDQTAVRLGDAAIQAVNQLTGRFNAQVPHLRQQALAAQAQSLAEVDVRGSAIFPSSSWNLPVPLPPDECVYITQSGQSYRAQLCNQTYTTAVNDLSQELRNNVNRPNLNEADAMTKAMVDKAADAASGLPAEALQQEAIAAKHGFFPDQGCALPPCALPIFGIAVTTKAGFAGQVSTGPTQQTVTYSVSELQVSGRRVSMTISRRSDQHGDTGNGNAVHFDLVLSADKQTLHGYCWTGQQRRECTLTRHAGASGLRNPRH
jgi:TonB family protein